MLERILLSRFLEGFYCGDCIESCFEEVYAKNDQPLKSPSVSEIFEKFVNNRHDGHFNYCGYLSFSIRSQDLTFLCKSIGIFFSVL